MIWALRVSIIFWILLCWGIARSADFDLDGIDDDIDNCTEAANPLQRDTDSDGFGNWCDADLDQNNAVNFSDLFLFKLVFNTPDADADLNGDGAVNFADLSIFKGLFNKQPGPSGQRGILLQWIPPFLYEDGSILNQGDLTGYNILYGPLSGYYPNSIILEDGLAVDFMLALPRGEWFFVVRARVIDSESANSGEASKTL